VLEARLRAAPDAILHASDLLELNGKDLRAAAARRA
jgi:hypothetical protein